VRARRRNPTTAWLAAAGLVLAAVGWWAVSRRPPVPARRRSEGSGSQAVTTVTGTPDEVDGALAGAIDRAEPGTLLVIWSGEATPEQLADLEALAKLPVAELPAAVTEAAAAICGLGPSSLPDRGAVTQALVAVITAIKVLRVAPSPDLPEATLEVTLVGPVDLVGPRGTLEGFELAFGIAGDPELRVGEKLGVDDTDLRAALGGSLRDALALFALLVVTGDLRLANLHVFDGRDQDPAVEPGEGESCRSLLLQESP
jgi:hypothetical protein